MVLFVTWGRRDLALYETMQASLIEAYVEAARRNHARIAPIGMACRLVRSQKGDLGRRSGSLPLRSDTVIADDQWHHVGVSWDGVRRTLYVDGIAVAEDPQTSLASHEGGLQISRGSDPRSVWRGRIDDVCVYDYAIVPAP